MRGDINTNDMTVSRSGSLTAGCAVPLCDFAVGGRDGRSEPKRAAMGLLRFGVARRAGAGADLA